MNFTRESIFISATRTFCNSFAVVIGVIAPIILIAIGVSALSSPIVPLSKNEITIAPDAYGNRSILPDNAPVILRINLCGVIGQGNLTTETFTNTLLDSQGDVVKSNRVKAIFLYVDTPGGTVSDADGIYKQLLCYKEKYKVPVYAFVDGLCASGGMYVCSAADKIYATNTSIIGSVGVILGPSFNFADAMEKIGIKSLTIKQGKDKDALNPFRPWVPGEDQSIINITKALYDNFVEIVSTSRKHLSKDKLINEYGAQVFISQVAQEYGYIDVANSSYDEALKDLTAASGLSEKDQYQVMQLEVPTGLLASLINGESSIFSGKMKHSFEVNPVLSSELSGKLLYLYTP